MGVSRPVPGYGVNKLSRLCVEGFLLFCHLFKSNSKYFFAVRGLSSVLVVTDGAIRKQATVGKFFISRWSNIFYKVRTSASKKFEAGAD